MSLLNKFEVALTWDLRTLLIPSLLPVTESDPENNITLKVNKCYNFEMIPTAILYFYKFQLTSKSPMRKKTLSDISNSHLNAPISRLLLISYFPSGFWSRLMIRILADTQIGDIAQSLYDEPIAEVRFCGFFSILSSDSNAMNYFFSRIQRKATGNCGNRDWRYTSTTLSYLKCTKFNNAKRIQRTETSTINTKSNKMAFGRTLICLDRAFWTFIFRWIRRDE